MREITENELRRAFGEKTFLKGLKYFEEGYVRMGMIKENKLVGIVAGSAPTPYKVKVEITDEIYSECTCPVRVMCKHGVALILQWINARDLFLNANDLLHSLEKKDRRELIRIISDVIEEEPFLALKLVLSEDVRKKRVNIVAISKRISGILTGVLDYYAVPRVVRELEKVKEIGDKLAEKGNLKDAIDIYLLLIEKGVDAFENGIDDSDGILGDFIIECIESFNENVEGLAEGQKRALIPKIMKIVEIEDYGLDTDEMLFSIASKENIAIIEEDLLRKISESRGGYIEYQRKRILDLLTNLYEYLGLHNDVFRVMIKAGLKNKDDYLRFAEKLIAEGRNEEAFEYVSKGIKIKEVNHDLDKLYFIILNQLLEEKKVDIKEEEMINIALNLLSFHFNSETYEIIKKVFRKVGRYETLILAIKARCKENIIISVLLHDNRIDEAIEYAISSANLYPMEIIKVAKRAKDVGKRREATELTLKALRQGLTSVNESVSNLIKLVVRSLDKIKLKEVIGHVRNISIARVFIDALLERNQEYAVKLLENFIMDVKKDEIKKYAKKLKREYALKVYHSWIHEIINRSHVYYNDAIDVLKTMKEIMDEKQWKEYIEEFFEANKGKKKLLEKIRDEIV